MPDDTRGLGKLKEEGREDEVKDIASKGGQAAHAKGTAHEFTPEEAREAGHKGGEKVKEEKGPEYFEEIGKKGGEARKEELGEEGYKELGHMGGTARGKKND